MAEKSCTKEIKRRCAGSVAFLLAAALLLAGKTPVMAVESDRDNSIRSVSVQNSQIAVTTLVIGSYLIDLAGLDDHIYEIAKESAGEFAQYQMYYKSELAGGQWFEITDAASIRDITNAGTPVPATVIEALAFTHRVAANGTVTDLRVQAAVNAFDIPDPYDLAEMEELQPIKLRWQYLQSKETKTASDEKYLEMLEIFYGLSIEDDTTRDCDASLDALNPYKLDVIARKKPDSQAEAVTKVMEGEDARRRVQSLQTLDSYLDELLKKAGGQEQEGLSREELDAFYETLRGQGIEYDWVKKINDNSVNIDDSNVNNNDDNVSRSDGSDGNAQDENWLAKWHRMKESYQKFLAGSGAYRSVTLDEDFQVDSDMISAIGEAKSNVKTSIAKYTGKLLAEGGTASAQAIYRYSKELIECAKANDTPACDGAAGRLKDLLNILKGVIEDSDSERGTLEDELAGQALAVWQGILTEGAGEAYWQAAGEGAGQPALTAFLSQRETDADSARLEYQTMLSELWKRMSNSLAQIDAGERINSIERLQALPPGDAAQKNLLGTVERHREWLRKSLAELVAASADSTALDQLLEEQNALNRQRLDALDKNDLAGAKKLSAEMEAGRNDINDLRKGLYHTLTDPDSSEADKTRAAAGMTKGSAGKLLGELADSVVSGILNGADGGSPDHDLAALAALAQYDPCAASAAVTKVRDALDGAAGSGADQDADSSEEISAQTADIERQIADIERQIGGAGTGTDKGRGMLSQEQLNSLLAAYFGDSATASDREQTGALIALSRYAGDTRNRAAKMLAVSTANRLAAGGSPYLYQKYDRAAAPYLSLQTVGKIGGYRYLFDDVHHIVTLQKAGTYYIFTAGSPVYVFTEGAEGNLSAKPVLQDTLYLAGDDGSLLFDCKGYYVPECAFAAAQTKEMEPVIEEVYNRLMEND